MDKVEQSYFGRSYYYWDEDLGLLFLKLKVQNEREKFVFCFMKGCERIKIKVLILKNVGVSDCIVIVYFKFIERVVVDVLMFKKFFGFQLKIKDYFLEVKLESFKQYFFYFWNDFVYIEVDGKKYFSLEDGIQVVVIDGS